MSEEYIVTDQHVKVLITKAVVNKYNDDKGKVVLLTLEVLEGTHKGYVYIQPCLIMSMDNTSQLVIKSRHIFEMIQKVTGCIVTKKVAVLQGYTFGAVMQVVGRNKIVSIRYDSLIPASLVKTPMVTTLFVDTDLTDTDLSDNTDKEQSKVVKVLNS